MSRKLPDLPEWLDGDEDVAGYYNELSRFWEARCRLAVDALSQIEELGENQDESYAGQIVSYIGPLPPEKKP